MGREGSGYWSGAGIVLRLAKGWKRSKIQQPRTHFASFGWFGSSKVERNSLNRRIKRKS
jgi:hypothetical protein